MYGLLLLSIIVILIYYYYPSKSFVMNGLADISRLPQSTFFSYVNISSRIHFSESQGVLYVPLANQVPHFGSIKSMMIRGNHRHKDAENSIQDEVLILLDGQFQVRIGDVDENKYEDHRFDIGKNGIVALKFAAQKCHAVKNLGKETSWFASYYVKSKEIITPPVDHQSCKRMLLT
ncbi:unnamed protein product [Adineta ricciae]|uniref:Uncharacterized protein n=1 Tax=Adineta ricciae TaxID=249248 RepID=A0A815WUR4_ADIRI|nr:unnamed protein product [Adineta ricciae]